MTIDPAEIGRRIKVARKVKLWSQADLAREASVSLSTVTRWESGKLPPVRELVRIADVLGVEPEWFVEMPSLDDPETVVSNARLARLEGGVAENHGLLVAIAAALGVPVSDGPSPDADDEQVV